MQSNKFVRINLLGHFVNDALYLLATCVKKKKEEEEIGFMGLSLFLWSLLQVTTITRLNYSVNF